MNTFLIIFKYSFYATDRNIFWKCFFKDSNFHESNELKIFLKYDYFETIEARNLVLHADYFSEQCAYFKPLYVKYSLTMFYWEITF